MKQFTTLTISVLASAIIIAQSGDSIKKAMDGFPPSRESQVSFQNYREYPYSQWSFRNAGAPFHVLMVPRAGAVHQYKIVSDQRIATTLIKDSAGTKTTFEAVFKDNYANGVIVLRNNTILYEQYWNGLSKDYQHIWFSMTKSLTSTALGDFSRAK